MPRHPFSHLLVLLQVSGVGLSAWPVDLVNRGPLPALALCVLGAAAGLYAVRHNRIGLTGIYPEPAAEARLVTSGPYRWVRHPMYASLLLMVSGIALYNLHAVNFLGLGLVVIAVLGKVAIEERLLQARFPEYAAYAARTPRFLPRLR